MKEKDRKFMSKLQMLSMVLMVFVFAGLMCGTTLTADAAESDYQYMMNETEDGTVITGYSGADTDLVIPDTLGGYPVVEIGDAAFQWNTSLVSVEFPDTVTKIGENAFGDCGSIKTITLPANIEYLGDNAFANTGISSIYIPKSLSIEKEYTTMLGPFYGCGSLKTITFEEGTTEIQDELFAGCYGLESVKLPAGITKIGLGAFQGCRSLKNVEFPESLTEIDGFAFSECSVLESLDLPSNLQIIHEHAFSSCTSIKELELPSGLKQLGGGAFYNCIELTKVYIPASLRDCSEWNGMGVFSECGKLSTVEFEEGIKVIIPYLFGGCTGLKKIEIPDTVTSIGAEAFADCVNLVEVKMSSNLQSLGAWAFHECNALTSIWIPKTLVSIDMMSGAFDGCNNLKTAIFEEGMTKIVDGLFVGCAGLTAVELPDSVTEIGTWAFSGCSNLQEVKLSSGLTKIGQEAFAGAAITSITIPDGVTEISDSAFYGCSKLSDVKLSANLEYMGMNAFGACTSLSSITIPKAVNADSESTTPTSSPFYGCDNLKTITFEAGTKEIPFRFCSSLSGLETVIMYEGVEKINAYAFEYCTSLTDIVFADSIETIDYCAFIGCSALENVIIPYELTKIDAEVFRDCTALTELSFNNVLTEIGMQAFKGCTSLVAVAIPETLSYLGTGAFNGCAALEYLDINSYNLTGIYNDTFNGCESLTEVELPYGVMRIDGGAFANCTNLETIAIPRTVNYIDPTAFDGANGDMLIYGVYDTYADDFAIDNDIDFEERVIPAEKVSLSKSSLYLKPSENYRIYLRVNPTNFTDEVTWTSSNEAVVGMSTDYGFYVLPASAGTATITVTVGSHTATCEVKVQRMVEEITLDTRRISIADEETYQLTATVAPAEADDKSIIWTSSNPEVATVDENGLVTAVAKGTSTIKAVAADGSGVATSCRVTVTNTVYRVDEVEDLESLHDYENDCTDKWMFIAPNAKLLRITFDERTALEQDVDYLYIYDGEGNEIGKYTGTELAGVTISVQDDIFALQLETNGENTAWGFKVAEISEVITEDTRLFWKKQVKTNLVIESGTLDLSALELTVKGDVRIVNGALNLGNGTLNVGGNFYIGEKGEQDEDGKYFATSTGKLVMAEGGTLNVAGDFEICSNAANELSGGVINLKGNFAQYGTAEKADGEYAYGASFAPATGFEVVLCGAAQSVYFESTASRFDVLTLTQLKSTYTFEPEECWVTLNDNEFVVTYELDGGVNAEQNLEVYLISGEEIELAEPEKEGYNFLGWYLDGAFTEKITVIAANNEADITVYAKWEKEPEPTPTPTPEPTAEPTPEPTAEPTPEPTAEPTPEPTAEPTPEPTAEPTPEPTAEPTPEPTAEPTPEPTEEPVTYYVPFTVKYDITNRKFEFTFTLETDKDRYLAFYAGEDWDRNSAFMQATNTMSKEASVSFYEYQALHLYVVDADNNFVADAYPIQETRIFSMPDSLNYEYMNDSGSYFTNSMVSNAVEFVNGDDFGDFAFENEWHGQGKYSISIPDEEFQQFRAILFRDGSPVMWYGAAYQYLFGMNGVYEFDCSPAIDESGEYGLVYWFEGEGKRSKNQFLAHYRYTRPEAQIGATGTMQWDAENPYMMSYSLLNVSHTEYVEIVLQSKREGEVGFADDKRNMFPVEEQTTYYANFAGDLEEGFVYRVAIRAYSNDIENYAHSDWAFSEEYVLPENMPEDPENPDDSEQPTPEEQVYAFVERMYTVALGRESDASGCKWWADALLAGNSDGAGLAEGFLRGGEFAEKGYSNEEYVAVLYATFFNREVAEGEADFWVNGLDSGATRESVLYGFVNSEEFFALCGSYGISRGTMMEDGIAINSGIGKFAERLYTEILERDGEEGGMEYWAMSISTKECTPEDAAKNFFQSPEYLAKNSTDEEYVKALYRTFMGRECDEAGLNYWVSALATEVTREKVLNDFAVSAEFKAIMAGYGL